MGRPTIFVASVLVWVAGNLAAASTQTIASGDGSHYETVATLPSTGATEGLCETSDGSFYVTGIDDQVLWKISSDGTVSKFSTLPAHIMGPLVTSKGFVATARRNTAPRVALPNGGIRLDLSVDIGTEVLEIDRSGKTVDTIPGPKGAYFNGIADTGHGFYVIADSAGPTIWRLDLAKKKITPWLKDDDLLSSPTDAKVNIAGNGLKVHDNWVYIGVSSRNAIYRIQMDSRGNPKHKLMLFAQGFGPDDFDITKNGTIYLPSGNTMYEISPTGKVTKFLDDVPGGPASRISLDGAWLYWSTRGGTEPQRLLRVAIPH
jgi:hypothetical protein